MKAIKDWFKRAFTDATIIEVFLLSLLVALAGILITVLAYRFFVQAGL